MKKTKTKANAWFTKGCERCKHYKSRNEDEGECLNENRTESVPRYNDKHVYVAAWWQFACLEIKERQHDGA